MDQGRTAQLAGRAKPLCTRSEAAPAAVARWRRVVWFPLGGARYRRHWGEPVRNPTW